MFWLVDVSERIWLEAALCGGLSLLVLIFGVFQRRAVSRAELLTVGAIGAGSAAFLLEPRFQWLAVVCCAIASIAAARTPAPITPEPKPIPPRVLKTLGITSFISIAALLLYRLGSFSPTLLTWEGTSLEGLLEQLRLGKPTLAGLQEYILWVDGVLSSGERSLLFGLPTYLASSWWSPSIELLRAISVFWMLGAIAVFARICRRYCGPVAACVAILVFGLNEAILVYGRYASSISATMFPLVVSFYLFFRLIDRHEISTAMLLVLSLFVSTLGYSPARISVLLLLGILPLCLLCCRGSYLRKAGVLLVVVLSAWMIFSFEAERGHKDLLLRARGEQFIDLVRSEEWRRSIFSEVAPGLPKGAWSKEQQYRAGLALVQKFTGPQLVGLLDPLSLEARSQFPFGDDPPAIKIIAPVLLPFFLVGFWSLWRRGRRHVGFTCAIVGTVGAIPLLFTTRVDTYRAIFLIVPLSICITAGLSEFIQIARRCKVPRTIVCLGFLAAMICGIAPRTQDMYQPQVEESLQQTAIVSTLRAISGPVVVVSQIDHKIEALIHMELFARLRRTRQASDFFEDHMANFLTDGEIDNAPVIVDKISRVVERGAVAMLVPSRSYKILAAKLQNAGYVVRTGRASNLPYWLVTKANVKLDPQVGEVTRLDTSIITPPLAATQDFVSHNPVYLSDLTPLEASYDFAPMNIGRSYSGQPVRWRNLGFLHGIGTHATTDLVYKVPNNSEGFQSWVGISSGVETCAKGSAQVVLSDQDGTRLYESPVLYAEANPIFISIPIPNVTSLRVHISNAGDGRDCDHVDLGDPAFMIPKSE